jgi:hypothetical protein
MTVTAPIMVTKGNGQIIVSNVNTAPSTKPATTPSVKP